MSRWSTVVLAAGLGTRMKSTLPKVLHPLAGRPLLEYPVRAAIELGSQAVVVVVSPTHRDAVRVRLERDFPETHFELVVQDPPRGTGDAARLGLGLVQTEHVLILCGDTPLVQTGSLERLLRTADDPSVELALLTAVLDEPLGYGRVLRDHAGKVVEVREHRDCSDEQRQIREVNAGMYVGKTADLLLGLGQLTPANAQGEYYLTDTIALAASRGKTVAGVVGDPLDLLGVNDRAQLVAAEELMFERIAARWARAGVTIRGGARIDDTVALEPETIIESGARLRGRTRVGRASTIDVGAVLTDTETGEGTRIGSYAVLAGVQVAAGAEIPALTREP